MPKRFKLRSRVFTGGYGYSWGFLLAGASNENGVDDDGNVWRFEWLLLRNL